VTDIGRLLQLAGILPEFYELTDSGTVQQAIEAEVDVIEAEPTGDQPINRQSARAVERDVARDIAHGHRGADVTALEGAFLGDEIGDGDR
jgi:hypothetical protein